MNRTVSGSLPNPDHLLHPSSSLSTPGLVSPPSMASVKRVLLINSESLLLKIYIMKFSVPHILRVKSGVGGLLAQ